MSKLSTVTVNSISKQYKKAKHLSLNNVSFNIQVGDKLGILGPNGAGKSTLISILTGILDPTIGAVTYQNEKGEQIDGNALKLKIGYVPQEYAIYEDLNLHQNVAYFGALYGLSKEEIIKVEEELLQEFGLEEAHIKKVKHYSGGMKRRLNLILSLLHKPEILFLDEPTAGVDVQNKHAIIQFLNQLSAKGTTLIYTSHHMDEAEQICNRIILLNKGEIVKDTNIEHLMGENPAESLTEIFLKYTEVH